MLTIAKPRLVEHSDDTVELTAEVDGHPSHANMRHALEELDFFSREVRILGVYPAHPFRKQQSAAE